MHSLLLQVQIRVYVNSKASKKSTNFGLEVQLSVESRLSLTDYFIIVSLAGQGNSLLDPILPILPRGCSVFFVQELHRQSMCCFKTFKQKGPAVFLYDWIKDQLPWQKGWQITSAGVAAFSSFRSFLCLLNTGPDQQFGVTRRKVPLWVRIVTVGSALLKDARDFFFPPF